MALLLASLTSAIALGDARDAQACGGNFTPPPDPLVETPVVSDHRMVLSLGIDQTILWDQVRYTGNPKEFAWVLPVHPGTTIELSRDEWIASLDAITQPQIVQPVRGSFSGDDEESGGGGCIGGGAAASLDSAEAPSPQAGGVPAVKVVSESVVGPYESVIVRSDQPKALEDWLQSHGFVIPDALEPTIAAYTAAKMDFAALRLRPFQGVQAMQPVRIVSPGADNTLPLRMVQAGVVDHVGLLLYVISEGPYRPMNFPEARIDDTKLIWNDGAQTSNYDDLAKAVMGQAGGTTWLTEYANKPTTLDMAYYGSCASLAPVPASTPADDAGADDAGTDDAGAVPVATVPFTYCQTGTEACCQFDDLELARKGLHASDVWVTRLRADLPASALATDLILEAHPDQTPVSNVHNANFPDGTTARISPARKTPFGTGILVFGAGLVVARLVRRRR